MTDITPLSADALATLVEDFEASDHNRMAMNAVTAAGVNKVARNYDRARLMQRRFSTIVDNGTATHQDRSGRCWLFSSLNVARFVAKKNMGLKNSSSPRTMPCTTTSSSASTTSCRMWPNW